MPPKINNCDHQSSYLTPVTADLIEIISLFLNDFVVLNNMYMPSCDNPFNSQFEPRIRIKNYLERFAKYMEFEEPHFLGMLIYLERYLKYNPHDRINRYNVHKLCAAFLLLSSKFLECAPMTNQIFSIIAEMPLSEVNSLESQAFFSIECNLYFSTKEYMDFKKAVCFYAKNASLSHSRQYCLEYSKEDEAYLNEFYNEYGLYKPLDLESVTPILIEDMSKTSESSQSSLSEVINFNADSSKHANCLVYPVCNFSNTLNDTHKSSQSSLPEVINFNADSAQHANCLVYPVYKPTNTLNDTHKSSQSSLPEVITSDTDSAQHTNCITYPVCNLTNKFDDTQTQESRTKNLPAKHYNERLNLFAGRKESKVNRSFSKMDLTIKSCSIQ